MATYQQTDTHSRTARFDPHTNKATKEGGGLLPTLAALWVGNMTDLHAATERSSEGLRARGAVRAIETVIAQIVDVQGDPFEWTKHVSEVVASEAVRVDELVSILEAVTGEVRQSLAA